MLTTDRKLRVFLCHASQDKPIVRELYHRLLAEGWIDSWLDEENLLPGQDFDVEIYKATRDADAIIICLSKTSVEKEGYVNKEIRRSLKIASEKPEGAIYVIPLRLDNCRPSFMQLRKLHWVDYFTPNAHQKLLRSLRARAEVLAIAIQGDNLSKTEQDVEQATPEYFVENTPHLRTTSSPNLDLYIPPEYTGEYFMPPPASVPSWQFGGMEFMKIPHGEFVMGSTDKDIDAYDDEQPQHRVNIHYDFLMARFLTTNALFADFIRETEYKTKAEIDGFAYVWDSKDWTKTKDASWNHPRGANSDIEGKGNHPVVQIFWNDAVEYCEWINRKHSASLPRGLTFRLPTEAEREKAARGKEGLTFPWGNKFHPEYCNWRGSSWGETSPVGIYSPQGDSPYGCADMSGNVWEWTSSLWGKLFDKSDFGYPYDPHDGRENHKAAIDVWRVLRGGSFGGIARYLRSAVRNRGYMISNGSGFRIVLAPKYS